MNDAALIQRYIGLRDTVKAMNDAHAKAIAPYAAGMQTIENEMLRRLQANGAQNVKSENGTAYQTTTTSVRLIDRSLIEPWALEDRKRIGIFTNAVSKDFVTTWIEANKEPPPGIEVTRFTSVNFRKS